MANTFVAIAGNTVGSGGASSIDFQNIPSSYTDLVLYLSVRTSSNDSVYISFNNTTTTYAGKFMEANGVVSSSGAMANGRYLVYPITTTTNTFAYSMTYIPNYTSSNRKAFYTDSAMEANSTTAYLDLLANVWENTAAIDRITLTPSAYTFSQYTTATLYGIKKD